MANRSSEVTAEWTVHAQLTILHPASKKSHNNNNENVEENEDENQQQKTNPIKMVYKWSTDDLKNESSFNKGNIVFSSSTDTKKVWDDVLRAVW